MLNPSAHSRREPAAAPAAHTYPYPWVRLRSASAGPLLYKRMIAEADPQAQSGDVVAVYDRHDALFGHGLYHARSQFALRMLSNSPDAVDEAFFHQRIEQAAALRRRLLEPDGMSDACRLIHAEGDGLSGLIADRYADWIVMEIFSLGVFRRLEMFKKLLTATTGVRHFVVRADERVQEMEGFTLKAELSDLAPRTITVSENGVRFRVDLRSGHKTGFFCDQRENRRRLADWCVGKEVLDACCYTGGFGIYAAKLGRAASVTGVDLDEDAIEQAKANTKLNEVRIQHVHADAFSYLRQMQTNGRRFDVVVLDPPKFVPTRDDYPEGSRKYVDLNTLGLAATKPGGLLLTCSCSGLISREDFLGFLKAAAGRLRRPIQILDQTGAGFDHPILANCPESGYLKALWIRPW